MYVTSKYVAQVYVYGDSLKHAVVAIVIPDEEVLMKWAKENGKEGSFQDLCESKVNGEGGRVGVWGLIDLSFLLCRK